MAGTVQLSSARLGHIAIAPPSPTIEERYAHNGQRTRGVNPYGRQLDAAHEVQR
jgi:hypothetical protein